MEQEKNKKFRDGLLKQVNELIPKAQENERTILSLHQELDRKDAEIASMRVSVCIVIVLRN